MGFKLTIGRRMGLGFGTIIVLTVVAFLITVKTLRKSKENTDKVVEQVAPSIGELKEFNFLLQRSQTLISKWYLNKSFNDLDFREELKRLIAKDYPDKKVVLLGLAKSWKPEELKQLQGICLNVDSLFGIYQNDIMNKLNSDSAYKDASLYMMAIIPYEDSETFIKDIYKSLNGLIKVKQDEANEVKLTMFKSFDFLDWFVKLIGITLVIGGMIVATYTVRSIVGPVSQLKGMLRAMSLGVLPKTRIEKRSDEIGEMATALEGLVSSMERTTQFANTTGAGNFDAEFKPLSEHDTLGLALLKMRNDLAENERLLEQKVKERTEEVVLQKTEIETKNGELEILYKQVTDSIHYAKRIQEAILPAEQTIHNALKNAFVLYKPKDIVSGDFYWIAKKGPYTFFATIDCTGHGVPGAFMSLVGHNILKDIIDNTDALEPHEIMNRLREGVIATLHASGSEGTAKDGMDMTLCRVDFKTMELKYAAAFNPLYIVRKGELLQYEADKFPIGMFIGEYKSFQSYSVQLEKDDILFIFSDGYADQFGGPKGKKFMVGNFRRLLQDLATNKPFHQLKSELEQQLINWQQGHEQVDDILIMGVRV
ncbi:MAG: SpoIIE family protein phosphatase [Sediminibacterium sp.]|nr:SpoIIE family protein phosphatase [Sediminibacterium sp.]